MQEYVAERKRLKANAQWEADRRAKQLQEVAREIKRGVDAIVSGEISPTLMGRSSASLRPSKPALNLKPPGKALT